MSRLGPGPQECSPPPSVGSRNPSETRSKLAGPDRIPFRPQGHAMQGLAPFSMAGSVLSTPLNTYGGASARIAPISFGGANGINPAGVMGVTYPMLSEAIKASRVPKFSGRPEDFEDFERRWNMHLRLMYGASPGFLDDTAVLYTLWGLLDEASATMLEGQMFVDPSLSYYKFWGEVKEKFRKDARTAHRQAWRAVRLQLSGNRVSLLDWNKFQAAYKAKRKLVEDWSEAEDQQNVFSQIPIEYHSKVLNEIGKRRSGKKWVRVVVPENLSAHEVMGEFG